MQTVRFSKKEDSNVIDIDDVKENVGKIYCCHRGNELSFLVNRNGSYHWFALNVRADQFIRFETFKEAMNCYSGEDFEILIFDSQCEVREYVKQM